jgi:predicted dehydrogenase
VAAAIARHRPDLVSVHSPPFLHRAHVEAAIGAGAAVLCDKPCSVTPADTAAMLAAAEAADVVHLVNFEFRHDPARLAVQRFIADGGLGAVQQVSWVHHSAGSRRPLRPHGWLFDASLGGGWIGAWASHAVDTLRWWLGTDLSVVASLPRTDITHRPDADGVDRECTAEDGVVAILRTESGVSVSIDSSFAAGTNMPARVRVVGSAGVLDCRDDRIVTWRRFDGTRGELDIGADVPTGADRHLLPMERWLEVVRESVRRGRVPDDAPTLHDGLAVDQVLAAMRGSVPATTKARRRTKRAATEATGTA